MAELRVRHFSHNLESRKGVGGVRIFKRVTMKI